MYWRLLNGGMRRGSVCAALILTACASRASSLPEAARACPALKPEACTMEYRPVTAYSGGGRVQGEFSNHCVACSEPGVVYTVLKNGPANR